MSDEFNTDYVVTKLIELLDEENLLREPDPFTLKYVKESVGDIIQRELGRMPDRYEEGYEKGYDEGKDAGYEDGHTDGKEQGREELSDTARARLYELIEDIFDE